MLRGPHRLGPLLPLLLAGGCLHDSAIDGTRSGGPRAAPAPATARVKLAILPVESDAFPSVARGLNEALRSARVPGVDERFVAGVTLEVVQLSIECVDATSACHRAVGRSLSANRLLMAQIAARAPTGGHHRDRGLKVTVTLFDVDAGAPISVIERSFKSAEEAATESAGLVAQTLGQPVAVGSAP